MYMHVRRRVFSLFSLCTTLIFGALVFLLAGALAWGQATNAGTLAGIVTDQSGAVVNGANVTLTDTATKTSRSATTNEAGRYVFVNVDPGNYDLSATKQGFSTTKTQAQVTVGAAMVVNLALQVGGGNVVVEVTAAGTELQTMNATVGNTVTAIALDNLPSLNRDVSTFVELQPGVSPDGSVAGAVVDQSSFMLDGGNNTNDMDGSMSVYTSSFAGDPTGGISNQSFAVAGGPTGVMPTPADSVEEFKVNSAGQTADFNSSAGAEVQVVTRRGTNAYHGSAYEYYLTNNWSANTWDNNLTGTPVPNWHRSRFGARFGGTLLPNLLGGKTYFFANYEGYRWPNSETIEKIVPSASMRLGLLTFDGGSTYYNLNPGPVTFNNVTYPGSTLDPRGIGINSLVQQMWNHMPLPNEVNGDCGLSRCDMSGGVGNIGGFKANLALPQTSNFGVFRLDHDFGDKWHFMSSYRYFKLGIATHDQVDIGGMLPGDKLGVPASRSLAPQLPWYLVAGLTTNISSNITNNFHYSFLRNWWSWSREGDTPQFDGLGGALEPLGESRDQSLSPYNVNTQQTRTRFWDGHDQMFRDDVNILHGNHLFAFGGTYQRNFNWHQRTDNGGGINYQPVYQLSAARGTGITVDTPTAVADAGLDKDWGRDYTAALGIVSISQQAYTRTGSNLTLNPPLTPAEDRVTIPFYNVYFSDTWHMKPSLTLTYGLGWTLEMPPVEKQGLQVELVDEANQLVDTQAYMHSREQAALQGKVYNPTVGFNLVNNTENRRKYPYDPYYGSFSPRVAVAWNPSFSKDTVIRGGYGRIYGRLNGVDLVLVPLLGTGLIQPVQCFGPLMDAKTCLGSGAPDASNAFRIGTDGLVAPIPAASATLPQPLYPGINDIAAGAGEALDPHFRPNVVDSFNLTIQRQLHKGMTFELGYIGRRIQHEYQPININAVPYMMTKGGQQFKNAYANVAVALGCAISTNACGANVPSPLMADGVTANPAYGNYINSIAPQPFFAAAMNPSYCNGTFSNGVGTYSNCTAAVVDNELGNFTGQNVWDLWSDLDNGGFNFPRSMMNTPLNCPTGTEIGCSGQLTSGVGVNASIGHGNYNALFASFKMSDWHGLTTQSNFTWSKTLSTGAVVQATSQATAPDPFNLNTAYGWAGFDRKFVYNLFFVYAPPVFHGQRGALGHILGGWTFAPIFTAGTGIPVTLGALNGGGEAFGEADSVNFFGNGNSENAVPVGHLSTGVHKTPGQLPNLFADPSAAYDQIRQPILGLDTKNGGWGVIRGLSYWNMDFSLRKNIKITERFNFEFQMVTVNLFNHPVFYDPGPGDYLDTSSSDGFGTLPGQGNTPRTMEFGLRLSF
jgi:Carboxypeptidase regulatory-like domain